VSTGTIAGRLDRIAAQRDQHDVRQEAARLAEVTGIAEAELLAEAQAIATVCTQQGITTLAGMIRFQADALGIPVAALDAEIAEIRELIP
jgi:hypothetical protein